MTLYNAEQIITVHVFFLITCINLESEYASWCCAPHVLKKQLLLALCLLGAKFRRTSSCYLWVFLLTPWSRVRLENLTGFQVVKKFPVCYGTRRFITASARHLSLSWASSIHSIPNYQSRTGAYSLTVLQHDTFLRWGVVSTSPPPPKLEDHPLSAVRDCLFNIFVATHHTVGRSSIRNLRTRHEMVTDTHLSRLSFPSSTEN